MSEKKTSEAIDLDAMQKKFQRKDIKRRSAAREVLERLVRNKLAMIGLGVVVVFAIVCLMAPIICPEGYDAQDLSIKFTAPCKEYIFGTDYLGRSQLARILYGGRISLFMGFVSTGIATVFGLIFGATAGYYGGTVDDVIMRFLDIFAALPNTLLAICISAAMGGGVLNCMIAVGISVVPRFSKTVRAPILAIKGQEYVEAAKCIKASNRRIIFLHLVPNVLSPLIVAITGQIASSIITASSLSFLGLGVQAPQPEWGALLSNARQYIRDYPYLVTFPGLAIAIVVLSMNLFGDGLRDALDPKLKY